MAFETTADIGKFCSDDVADCLVNTHKNHRNGYEDTEKMRFEQCTTLGSYKMCLHSNSNNALRVHASNINYVAAFRRCCRCNHR